MSEMRFKTEWLEQIELLAAGGSLEDVKSLCHALRVLGEGGEKCAMTALAAMAYNPIAAEVEEQRAKHERRVSAGRKGGNPMLNHSLSNSLTNAKAEVNHSLTKEERKEKESKEEKNQKKKVNKENKREESTDALVDNTNVLSPRLSCAEPVVTALAPAEPPVITMPLNDGSEFPVTTEMVSEWSSLYPAVDVMQELRNMRGWCLGKPERRKTKRGVKAFINTWLSKEQDRGPAKRARSGTTSRRLTPEEVAALPPLDPFAELRGLPGG